MVRFFVEAGSIEGQTLLLTGENAQHAKVLRLKNGDQILVCDGQGTEGLCRIENSAGGALELSVLAVRPSATEPRVRVRIFMAYPKSDKLEHVIQKATELGAREIIAFPSARCVSKPDDKSLKKKVERWQKIALSAAQQSGRGIIPTVRVLPSYKAALEEARQDDLSILFYENEAATTLHMALTRSPYGSVSILTGPEGGWEEAEVLQASAEGLTICTLGKRILRCETAPLCALSAVMYDSGEF